MTTCAIQELLICGQTQEILENTMKHENKMTIAAMKNLKPNRLSRFGAALLITLLFAMVASNTRAALIAYEPYNYAIGATVGYASGTPSQTQGGGFSSGYNGNPGASTAVAGLTYPGLGTADQALNQTASKSGENLANPPASGTLFISYLIKMGVNPGGNLVGLEMNTSGNGMFVGVTAPYSGTTGYFGVNQQSGNNDNSGNKWQSSTPIMVYGTTNLIVIELTGTGAGWTGSIWVNPTANTSTPPTPTGTFTMPQFTLSACSIVNPNGGAFNFDELRIGTTWADAVDYVVPAPSTPTGLSATSGGNSVSLTWNAAAGSPTSYNVKRSTTSGSGYVTVSSPGAVTGTNFTDLVVGGTTYYYVVSAVNSGGESANSSEVSAAPTLVAPAAPTGLAASASDGQVTLSWSASLAATGYKLKRATTSGAEVTLATLGTTSYTDSTVANGTTYFYEVSATNSAGEGVNSSEVSASPVAYVPVYESFNYPLGSFATGTANTASGLTGNWTVGNGTIVSGLTYPGLPSGHNALSTTGSRDQVSLASPLSTGTKYISFLFNQLGNNGGNLNGVVLFGSGSSSLVIGLTAPYSGTAGCLGLGSIATAGAGATGITTFSGQQITGGFNYNQTHLIVVRIDFNTSGANDTVSLWLDPVAGTNAPAGAANLVWSDYDVGTITGIGFNTQGGGNADEFDEIRTGNTYGSVVGAPIGAVPTTLALSVSPGTEISWSAISTDYYQVQSSPDDSSWSDVGSELTGSAVTSAYDPASAAYYQVLQDTPVTTEEVQNGSFEGDDSGGYSGTWAELGTMPPTQDTADFHTGAACEALYVTNASAAAQTSILQQNVYNAGGAAVIPGNTYTFSFWVKSLPATGYSYVQQYNPVWLDGGGNILGTLLPGGWTTLSSSVGGWTEISPAPAVAPAGAVTLLIQIEAVTGQIAGDSGGLLVDDVSLTTVSPSGSPTVIPATVQAGGVFTATVQASGVTATAATGTVAFRLNSVAQSVGTVASGAANSTPTAVPADYTLTAIYSGDSVYAGSTNTLTVMNVNTTPTNIVTSVSGKQLTLSWPADHTGWTLQAQTNSLRTGLAGTWFTVAGSTTTNQMIMTIDPANPAVFYRLQY